MNLGGAAQRLSSAPMAVLAGVVDQQHGASEADLEFAQRSEQGGDLAGLVLVDRVQPDQRVEGEQPGPDAFDGFGQPDPVGGDIEAQPGGVDDLDVEAVEGAAGGAGDAGESFAENVPGVLGGEQQRGSGGGDGEPPQAAGAGGDGDGDVERQEGLAALRLAADDAHRLVAPELLDQPLLRLRPGLQVGRAEGGEAAPPGAIAGRTHRRARAVSG